MHDLNLKLLYFLPVRLRKRLLVRRQAQVAPREQPIQQLAELFLTRKKKKEKKQTNMKTQKTKHQTRTPRETHGEAKQTGGGGV